MRIFFFLIVMPLLVSMTAIAQPIVKIRGVIKDQNNKPLPLVTVTILNQNQSTLTDSNGVYNIYSGKLSFSVKYNLLGYKPEVLNFNEKKGARITQNLYLKNNVNELEQVSIANKQNQLTNSMAINLEDLSSLPSVSGNFESILKIMPGVSPNNELSAQYSVRGGNFDENLIYINDVEINRPILIRNGHQEGLSFINSDLATRIRFSSGGFGARYGDKLSSVLDVSYQHPDSNQLTLKAGLLGFSLTSKSLFKNSYLLVGLRYKNNSNVLKKQDIRGSYIPNFSDLQLLYQYNFSAKFSVNMLTNVNISKFRLVPDERDTKFGTLGAVHRLRVRYEGKEVDEYQTYGGALTSTFTPHPNLIVKWINSYFNTIEREKFDIEGNYIFDELSVSFGLGFPEVRINKGIGGFFNHARNSLNSKYFTSELKADQSYNNHVFSIGFKAELNKYRDVLNEYNYIDSVGYILPASSKRLILNTIVANNVLQIKTFSAFAQDSYALSPRSDLLIGARVNYNNFSKELLLSPRLLLAYRPYDNKILRFTAGIYRQPPNYRSIRNVAGHLYKQQKSQRSYNASVGYDYAFDGLGTRLKFTSEAYFKYTDRMIPYVVDNVRIKYLANQQAQSFTYGVDFSVRGEFVKDLVSYLSLSLLKANQDIYGDFYSQKNGRGVMETTHPKFMRRPTDQRVNFSIFFQDRLLNSPTYMVHLNLLYGSRLPIGSPYLDRYTDNYRIPAYKRIDIGFSKDFLDDNVIIKNRFLNKYFDNFIVYVEIFNLLNINNTVSYLWLKDVDNVSYAVPNYFTGRQINAKLILKFKN